MDDRPHQEEQSIEQSMTSHEEERVPHRNTLLPASFLWTSAICTAFSSINLLLLPPFPPRARIGLGVIVVLLTFSASAAHLRSFWRNGTDRRMESNHIMRLLAGVEQEQEWMIRQEHSIMDHHWGLRTSWKNLHGLP